MGIDPYDLYICTTHTERITMPYIPTLSDLLLELPPPLLLFPPPPVGPFASHPPGHAHTVVSVNVYTIMMAYRTYNERLVIATYS